MGAERTRAVIARAAPVVLVFVATLVAFGAGVDTTAIPDMAHLPIPGRIYYAIGLFLLGGMDLGTPVGGPHWARMMLWVAYFLGPAITTGAVVEGTIRLVDPLWLRSRRYHDHVVLVGLGRLGCLYLDAIHHMDPGRKVIAVDRNPASPGALELTRRNGTSFRCGDITRGKTRAALSLGRAHAVILATDNDMVNLGAAWEIAEANPALQVAAHVTDLRVDRSASRLARGSRVRVFNSHEIAAVHLFEHHLAQHFAQTGAKDVVVVAGFGRFGQTILRHIQDRAATEVDRTVVIDVQAGPRSRQYDEQVGFHPECPCTVIEADIADPATWARLVDELKGIDVVPVFVLSTSDDATNLQAAIGLRNRFDTARIFVRSFTDSAFVEEMARHYRFEPLALDRMLVAALREHYRTCFT